LEFSTIIPPVFFGVKQQPSPGADTSASDYDALQSVYVQDLFIGGDGWMDLKKTCGA
jgi:hypothetical protein